MSFWVHCGERRLQWAVWQDTEGREGGWGGGKGAGGVCCGSTWHYLLCGRRLPGTLREERRKRLMFVFLRGSALCVAEKAQSAERRRWRADRQTDRQKGRWTDKRRWEGSQRLTDKPTYRERKADNLHSWQSVELWAHLSMLRHSWWRWTAHSQCYPHCDKPQK